MGNFPTVENSGIRLTVVAELEQNIERFNRFWQKLEGQRAKTLNQSMEQAFIEAVIPVWEQTTFHKYIGYFGQVFIPQEIRALHSIYSHLNNISTLQTEIQQAKEQTEKVRRVKMNFVNQGIYNSSLEPHWNSEIERLNQKSGEAWIDLVHGKRNVESDWNFLQQR